MVYMYVHVVVVGGGDGVNFEKVVKDMVQCINVL